ncbi:hypothetical protein QQ045_017324 [Rhodiola kirilowii]
MIATFASIASNCDHGDLPLQQKALSLSFIQKTTDSGRNIFDCCSMSRTDSHPIPPPGRIRKSKYMDYWKNVEEIKADTKQKRVFGTQRNTNVLVKSKTEKKTTGKSKVETEVKQPKLSKLVGNEKQDVSEKAADSRDELVEKDAESEPELTEKAEGFKAEETENDEVAKPGTDERDEGLTKDEVAKPGSDERDEGLKKDEVAEKAEEKPAEEIEIESNKKKKSVGFREKLDEMISAPRTPVQLSSSLRKPRRSGTPYHTAQNCRRCRNDKLESSSYWIEQIKLAESVGKHFASIMFFQLAHECNAEVFIINVHQHQHQHFCS